MKHTERLQMHDGLELRLKDPSYSAKRNPRVIVKLGASYSRDAKKQVHREMRVDKVQGLYREVISDPDTGEVIHQCEEPLSQHRGHGDDKRGR